MFENLRKLYGQYGGIKAVLTSWYFWVAALLSVLSYESIFDFAWVEIALGVLPSLTGFTIAAFAIIFAILDAEMLKKLMAPDEKGRSPVSSIAASIGHAVFVQISALILAMASKTINLGSVMKLLEEYLRSKNCSLAGIFEFVVWIKNFVSGVGLLLTFYGVILVLAAILSIVRMQIIVAGTAKGAATAPKKSDSK